MRGDASGPGGGRRGTPLADLPAEFLGLDGTPVDDYRSAPADSPWSQPWSSNTVKAATVLGALLVGFLLTSGLSAGRTVAREQDDRRAELISLINERQEHTDVLAEQLEGLRGRVEAAEALAAAGAPALRARVAEMEAAAGLTRVAGPGVTVTLTDATGSCPTGRGEDCRIQDTDLQLVVNALFALGAEAVAVNGERVIGTTAIRSAGRAVLVNYRVLTSPYRVEAIGEAALLSDGFRASELSQDFAVWRDVYGLGYAVEETSRHELPRYAGSIRLRTAVAVEGGT